MAIQELIIPILRALIRAAPLRTSAGCHLPAGFKLSHSLSQTLLLGPGINIRTVCGKIKTVHGLLDFYQVQEPFIMSTGFGTSWVRTPIVIGVASNQFSTLGPFVQETLDTSVGKSRPQGFLDFYKVQEQWPFLRSTGFGLWNLLDADPNHYWGILFLETFKFPRKDFGSALVWVVRLCLVPKGY